MTRLVLALMMVAAAVIAVQAVAGLLRPERAITARRDGLPARQEDHMPRTFRTIAYGLLVMLLFGAATGWLGGS